MKTQQIPPLNALPMQLMLAMGTWLTSPSALQCVKSASQPWKQLAAKNNLHLSAAELAELNNAVLAEAKNRSSELLTGILRYLEAPYERKGAEPPAIWKKGNARLLDYGKTEAADSSVVLFIPSLINRYYILDLDEERSMLRYFSTQGCYPLMLDWETPGKLEKEFNVEQYITELLLPAIEFVYQTTGKPVSLVGYCMGGVLALAAAQLKPKQVGALALLATPWDFHCKTFAPFVVDERWHKQIATLLASQETLPAEVIQSLFYWTDPWVFENKFRRFAELAKNNHAAHEFVALEHWVNDGVPMTAGVAQDCLIGWAQQNQLYGGQWTVDGKKIDPAKIKQPTFIAIPQNDHVVPHDCAMPLADAMPKAKILYPGAGHVGMIVGRQAKKELWQPLVGWITRHCEEA